MFFLGVCYTVCAFKQSASLKYFNPVFSSGCTKLHSIEHHIYAKCIEHFTLCGGVANVSVFIGDEYLSGGLQWSRQ